MWPSPVDSNPRPHVTIQLLVETQTRSGFIDLVCEPYWTKSDHLVETMLLFLASGNLQSCNWWSIWSAKAVRPCISIWGWLARNLDVLLLWARDRFFCGLSSLAQSNYTRNLCALTVQGVIFLYCICFLSYWGFLVLEERDMIDIATCMCRVNVGQPTLNLNSLQSLSVWESWKKSLLTWHVQHSSIHERYQQHPNCFFDNQTTNVTWPHLILFTVSGFWSFVS